MLVAWLEVGADVFDIIEKVDNRLEESCCSSVKT